MIGCCRRGRVFLAVAVAGLAWVVAVLAGCSSSSSSKTTTSTAAGPLSSSSSTAAASPSGSPASAAQLAKIVLQPADFPVGWEHTPYKPNSADSTAAAEFAKCLGVPNSDTDPVAEAHSDDFALGEARISSPAYSFRSQSTVDAYTAGLLSAKASPCVEQLVRQQIASVVPTGGTIESVSLRIVPGSVGGLPNIVATTAGTFKVKVSGKSVGGNFTVAFINGPLIEADVSAFSVGAPVPTDLMGSLAADVAGRAAQA